MSVTNIHPVSELTAAHELRAMMQGRIVLRGDDDYIRTRQIWNGAVKSEPALLAVCETSADVQAAVGVARRHGLPFSVRGGGHHWAGLALRPDGLVIDLTRMRQVIVDPHSRVATVAGGAKALPGGYASFLTSRDQEQAKDAYGGNGVRLRTLKRRFDPGDVFASTIPLPN